ncbi:MULTISPECIES: hypothetical protein [Paraburkholderia]|uniref:Uncharacterized protein n=1 Tax=Paraburkholderia metrosideri TaxID=580937 RepID=A0ABW9E582_9BURK
MKITFGKHAGKSSEEVVLKHGSYAKWVLEQTDAGSGLASLHADLKRLVASLMRSPS